MKKTLFFVMTFFIAVAILQGKNVGVDMINLPPTYEGLKKKYISCVLDLFKEMDEHKKTLTLLSNVQTQNSNLIALAKDLKVKLEQAVNAGRDTFQNYITLTSGYNFEDKKSYFGVGWTGILYEKILIGTKLQYPYILSLEAGYKF